MHDDFRCIYYISGAVLKAAVAVIATAGIACAAAPAAEQAHTIAPGVKVLGHAGRRTDRAAGAAPHRPRRRAADHDRLPRRDDGRDAAAARPPARAPTQAVRSALAATPRSRIGLPVQFSDDAVAAYVDSSRSVRAQAGQRRGDRRRPRTARSSARAPRSRRREADDARGDRAAAATGSRDAARADDERGHADADTLELQVDRRRSTAARTRSSSTTGGSSCARSASRPGRRSTRRRRALLGREHAGEPVVDAAELVVGAGRRSRSRPGRATRSGRAGWGSPRPGVGMHGTPDDASIGYSRSHGCIRMHISDAEWLFTTSPSGRRSSSSSGLAAFARQLDAEVGRARTTTTASTARPGVISRL